MWCVFVCVCTHMHMFVIFALLILLFYDYPFLLFPLSIFPYFNWPNSLRAFLDTPFHTSLSSFQIFPTMPFILDKDFGGKNWSTLKWNCTLSQFYSQPTRTVMLQTRAREISLSRPPAPHFCDGSELPGAAATRWGVDIFSSITVH